MQDVLTLKSKYYNQKIQIKEIKSLFFLKKISI
jgi:hypothetical protein